MPRTEFFPFSVFLAYQLLNILQHTTYLVVQFWALLGAFSLHRNVANCWVGGHMLLRIKSVSRSHILGRPEYNANMFWLDMC